MSRIGTGGRSSQICGEQLDVPRYGVGELRRARTFYASFPGASRCRAGARVPLARERALQGILSSRPHHRRALVVRGAAARGARVGSRGRKSRSRSPPTSARRNAVVPARAPQRQVSSQRPLRVLHVPTMVAGIPQSLAAAERKLGLDSHSAAFFQTAYGYEADEIVLGGREGRVHQELRRWRFLFKAAREVRRRPLQRRRDDHAAVQRARLGWRRTSVSSISTRARSSSGTPPGCGGSAKRSSCRSSAARRGFTNSASSASRSATRTTCPARRRTHAKRNESPSSNVPRTSSTRFTPT